MQCLQRTACSQFGINTIKAEDVGRENFVLGICEKTLEETFSQIMRAKFYLPASEAFIDLLFKLAFIYLLL